MRELIPSRSDRRVCGLQPETTESMPRTPTGGLYRTGELFAYRVFIGGALAGKQPIWYDPPGVLAAWDTGTFAFRPGLNVAAVALCDSGAERSARTPTERPS